MNLNKNGNIINSTKDHPHAIIDEELKLAKIGSTY